ncbi:MAG: hypothetical protein IRZ07_03020, partial [Microbispora sp.]|nr:hypothetical protein [Microbispora sp.]
MARHDREDPHLQDQLAWLDAIKEMPDEVEIAVSAVTSVPLASPPQPAPADPEPASPYPADPWSLVQPESVSRPLLRGVAATGSAYGAPPREGEETSEASSTSRIRDPLFGGDSGYSSGFGTGYGYGETSPFGETTAFGDTTAAGDTTTFVARPESPSPEEPEDAPQAASGTSAEEPGRDAELGTYPERPAGGVSGTSSDEPGRDAGLGTFPERPARDAFGSFPERPAEGGASAEAGPGAAFGTSSGVGSEPPAASGDAESGGDRDRHSTTPAGGPGDPSSYTTPLFGERPLAGTFPGFPVVNDPLKAGTFSGSEPLTSFDSPASAKPKETLRGWLEPAVPVSPAQPEPTAAQPEPVAEPEEPPAPPEIPSPFAAPRAEATPDYPGDRFTGSLRENLAAEERKPYEPGPVAAAAPAPERVPAPGPAPEQPPVMEPAAAEREAYQPPRRPAPPARAFASPARTTGAKAAGSKPTADSLDPDTLLRG